MESPQLPTDTNFEGVRETPLPSHVRLQGSSPAIAKGQVITFHIYVWHPSFSIFPAIQEALIFCVCSP